MQLFKENWKKKHIDICKLQLVNRALLFVIEYKYVWFLNCILLFFLLLLVVQLWKEIKEKNVFIVSKKKEMSCGFYYLFTLKNDSSVLYILFIVIFWVLVCMIRETLLRLLITICIYILYIRHGACGVRHVFQINICFLLPSYCFFFFPNVNTNCTPLLQKKWI